MKRGLTHTKFDEAMQMGRKMTLDDVDAMWNQWLFLYTESIKPASRTQRTSEIIPLKHEEDSERAEKIFEKLLEKWKMPIVLVKRNGELLFNSTAKEFEIVEEVTDAVELSIAMDYFRSFPVCILLTDSLRTLLENVPEMWKTGRLDVVGLVASTSLDKNHPLRRK